MRCKEGASEFNSAVLYQIIRYISGTGLTLVKRSGALLGLLSHDRNVAR